MTRAKGGVEWRRYAACPMCEAPPGEPCTALGVKRPRPVLKPHAQRKHTRGGGHSATIPAYYVQPVQVGGKAMHAVMRERNGRHKSVVTYLDEHAANRMQGHLTELAPDET